MATFTPYVNTYERKDKKRRVHILICAREDDKCYMDTGIYVVKGQLSKDLKSIKDKYILSTVLDKIKEWFQFYLSSIKSRAFLNQNSTQTCFNSTLVQLKVL